MNNQPDPPASQPSEQARQDVLNWLQKYGDAIYAYAVGRVEHENVADDLVQETFLAALKNHDRFAGRSSAKTWLIAILRNKIIEHYRRRSRKRDREQSLEDSIRPTFGNNGIWKVSIGPWPKSADESFQNQEFWNIFADCLSKLPARLADVFTLRVLDQIDVENVCKTLEISSSNMAVRLHRARIALRNCLGKNWFGDD